MRAHWILPLAAALALPTVAAAQVNPWVGFAGAWAGYSMTDVNHQLDAWTAELTGTGMSMKDINGGFGYGVEMGLEVNKEMGVGVGYDRLTARSECSGEYGSIDYKLPANAIRVFAEYRPPAQDRLRARFGVSGGMLSSAGTLAIAGSDETAFHGTLYGSGLLFEVYAGANLLIRPNVAMTTVLGHRRAKIAVLAVDADNESFIAHNPDGTKEAADYGGVFARFGLAFAWGD